MADDLDLVKGILLHLNASPFNKNLSLVSLDQKTPRQLISLLNDVLKEVSPEHNIDPKDEQLDATVNRMSDAMLVLGYRLGEDPYAMQDFKDGLQSGRKEVIYPALLFLLQGLTRHRTKAYLARFLRPLAVPEEITYDDSYQQYRDAMDEFKDVHKQVLGVREAPVSLQGLRREVFRLEQEVQNLNAKLDRARKKVSDVPNSAEMLSYCTMLRTELENKQLLTNSVDEQGELLRRVRIQIQEAQENLREMQTGAGRGPEGLLEKLEEDLRTNRFLQKESLPKELSEMMDLKQLLETVLSDNSSDNAMAHLHQEILSHRHAIRALEDRLAEQKMPEDDQLAMYRQQVAALEKKKNDMERQLRGVQGELDEALQELKEMESRAESMGLQMRGPQLESFLRQVAMKEEEAESVRQSMQHLQIESGILKRTADILSQDVPDYQNFVQELEERGSLERRQEEGVDVDEDVGSKVADLVRGKSLEEISRIVADLTERIKLEKKRLAPQVKELKSLRLKCQEVEAEHTERKKTFDVAMLGVDDEQHRLDLEQKAYTDEWTREESRFHYLNCMLMIQKAQLQKAQDAERLCIDRYTSKVRSQGQLSEILRSRQKIIKETIEPNKRQAQMFIDLRNLLRTKLDVYRRPKRVESVGIQDGAADRMVIS